MTESEFINKIDAFIEKGELPDDDIINEIANDYKAYREAVGGAMSLHCRDHFIIGFIFACKAWQESLKGKG